MDSWLLLLFGMLGGLLLARIMRRPPPPPPEVTLDETSFGQWLIAGRPDLRWFLCQTPRDRQIMADLGETWHLHLATQVGYAVRNPVVAENLEDAAKDPRAELELLGEFLAGAANARRSQVSSDPPPKVRTFAGLGKPQGSESPTISTNEQTLDDLLKRSTMFGGASP